MMGCFLFPSDHFCPSLYILVQLHLWFIFYAHYKPVKEHRFILVASGRYNGQYLITSQTHSSFPSLQITFIQRGKQKVYSYSVSTLRFLFLSFLCLQTLYPAIHYRNPEREHPVKLNRFLLTPLRENDTCNRNRLKVSLALASITGSHIFVTYKTFNANLVF